MVDQHDMARRLEAAFRTCINVPTNKEEDLGIAIEGLSLLARELAISPPAAAPDRFRSIGRSAIREELDQLAKAAEAFASQLDGLHQRSIVALADRRAC
jgi:hypothetical protein